MKERIIRFLIRRHLTKAINHVELAQRWARVSRLEESITLIRAQRSRLR